MAVLLTGNGPTTRKAKFVEYLQSSGTQYIDTGVKASNAVGIEVKFSATQSSQAIAAGAVTWKSSSFEIFSHIIAYNNTSYQISEATDGAAHTIVIKNGVCTLDGVQKFSNTSSFNAGHNIALFATNRSGQIMQNGASKLYYCKMWLKGTLVHDFWPCFDTDGVACLYDKVTKEYYYNAGTGEFTAG